VRVELHFFDGVRGRLGSAFYQRRFSYLIIAYACACQCMSGHGEIVESLSVSRMLHLSRWASMQSSVK